MLLRKEKRTPTWPYVAVVTCLFLLSILASSSWRLRSRSLPGANGLDLPPPVVAPDQVAEFVPLEGPVVATLPEPSPQALLLERSFDSANDPVALFTTETPRQIALTAPLVGEQIKWDISVQETPALPSAPTERADVTQEDASQAKPVPEAEALPPMAEELPPEPLERSPAVTIPDVASVFPRPQALIETLRRLAENPRLELWANNCLSILDQLHRVPTLVAPEVSLLLDRLAELTRQTQGFADQTPAIEAKAEILRTGFALQRRIDIWRQVQKIAVAAQDGWTSAEPAHIVKPLDAVQERLQSASYADDWRKYLLLDDVLQLSRTGSVEERRALARRVLKRIDSPDLTDSQANVFQQPPFDSFRLELRRWAGEPVDYLQLLDDIELYERTNSTTDAERVAASYNAIRWSAHPEVEKLAMLLNTHYRNSNVRVALTSDFLNRMLPDPAQVEEEVAESISGADVYGTSRIINRLKVVFVPDANHWRIGLEAHGEVESDTAASKGPATFYNQGFARYYARKLLLVDRRGIRVWRAEAVADSQTELRGFETDYDAVPLIGWLARSMARQQHDDHYYEAKAETEAKLETRATERFDDEVHRQLSRAETRVQEKLLRPFERIDLKPTPVDLHTTEQRVIARYRLAGDEQVGAHTPRPQAPGDSLMSVQVHESALNNTLANLKLEGRRIDLRTLYSELAATFERPEIEIPDDIPENVIVQFADDEAVRVRCEDGRVSLTIRIAELKSGRNFQWTNFAVRAYYVPDANQLDANLVRDGVIEMSGERLGDKLPLRAIFNRVLSRSRVVNIVNNKLAESPRLADVHVNQFVISDGWIGVAMGPNAAGGLEHLAKQKSTTPQR